MRAYMAIYAHDSAEAKIVLIALWYVQIPDPYAP